MALLYFQTLNVGALVRIDLKYALVGKGVVQNTNTVISTKCQLTVINYSINTEPIKNLA